MSRPTGGLYDNKLTFAGVELCETFNAVMIHGQVLNVPARSYTRVNVPAKNGVQYIDEGTFGNVTQTYTLVIPERFWKNYNDLKAYLMSVSNYDWLIEDLTYAKVQTEYTDAAKNFLMRARVTSVVPRARRNFDSGKVTITFDRLPQRYHVTGNPKLTDSGFANVVTAWENNILNPFRFDANPVFRVVGSGNFVISHDDGSLHNVTIAFPSGSVVPAYIDIDSEAMDCYCGNTNCNMFVTMTHGFPVLKPGNNNYSEGQHSSMTVTVAPRWWTV